MTSTNRAPAAASGKALTVLQSFPVPRPTTNPYLVMLGESLRSVEGIRVLNFSWRAALFRGYDVYHSHWPEILVSGHSPLKRLVRQAFVVLFLLRLRALRTPIVRTVHNIELPEGLSRREKFLLAMIDRQTTLRIRLNSTTPISPGLPFETISHGHYRDWFAKYQAQDTVPGQIGYVGLIRRYKGVEGLLSAFCGLGEEEHPGLSLRVGGNPSTEELAAAVTSFADRDARIRLELTYISDATLVEIVTSSELVVLPYRFMHNSGGTLAALSLDRPVLIPDNEVNRRLENEVGPGWVYRFTGDLTSAQLNTTLESVRNRSGHTRPVLNARNWDCAGLDHIEAYRRAISIRRRGGTS